MIHAAKCKIQFNLNSLVILQIPGDVALYIVCLGIYDFNHTRFSNLV